ncbi:MAG: PAS domain-containing protein, partial [bacterium]|nr:PAS domain-containing protein [bacterium]
MKRYRHGLRHQPADTQGKVVLLNNVAEELTGWPEKEAINKSTTEIFYIINEYTRKQCENPATCVVENYYMGKKDCFTDLIYRLHRFSQI